MLEFSKTKISQDAINVLNSMDITDNLVYLNSGELERKVYLEVSKIMEYLRGKWVGGKTNAFTFNHNPTDTINKTIETGLIPDKNPTAYFPTPKPVIDRVLEIARLDMSMELEWDILEPSAGGGAIAEEIRRLHPTSKIDVVEFLDINQAILREKGFEPHCGDFMEFNSDKSKKYDAVIMNPPFSVKGDKVAYITHIMNAFEMLKEHGMVVAIVPTGFMSNSDKKSKEFLDFVISHGDIEMLPSESFKESGTKIDTAIVSIEKKYWKQNPVDEYTNHFSFDLFLSVENDQNLCKKLYSLKGKPKSEKILFIEDTIKYLIEEGNRFPLSQMDNYLEDLNELVGDRAKDTLF